MVRVMGQVVRVGRAEHVRAMMAGYAGRAVLMETSAEGQLYLLLAA